MDAELFLCIPCHVDLDCLHRISLDGHRQSSEGSRMTLVISNAAKFSIAYSADYSTTAHNTLGRTPFSPFTFHLSSYFLSPFSLCTIRARHPTIPSEKWVLPPIYIASRLLFICIRPRESIRHRRTLTHAVQRTISHRAGTNANIPDAVVAAGTTIPTERRTIHV